MFKLSSTNTKTNTADVFKQKLRSVSYITNEKEKNQNITAKTLRNKRNSP